MKERYNKKQAFLDEIPGGVQGQVGSLGSLGWY